MYNTLIENGLGQMMDKSIYELLQNDEIYLKDSKDLEELERRYSKLEIPIETKRIINDYIACIESTADHYSEVAYMAGVKDSIKLLVGLGLICK